MVGGSSPSGRATTKATEPMSTGYAATVNIRFFVAAVLLLEPLASSSATDEPVLEPTDQVTWNSPFNRQDYALAIRSTPSDGVLLAAEAYELGASPKLALVKFDAELNKQWEWFGSEFSTSSAPALALEQNQTVLLAAVNNTVPGELLIRRLSLTDGSTLWQQNLALENPPGADLPMPVLAVDPQTGNFTVAVMDSGDVVLLRFLADGAALADIRFDTPETIEQPLNLSFLDNGVLAVNFLRGDLGSGSTYLTTLLDSNGTAIASDNESGDIGSLFTSSWIKPDANNGLIVLGGPESSCGLFQTRIWRLNAQAERLWTSSWPEQACHSWKPINMEILPDQSIMVGALANDATTGFNSAFGVLRIDPIGPVLWSHTWTGTVPESSIIPRAVASSDNGRLRVVGQELPTVPTRYLSAEWNADGTQCLGAVVNAPGNDPIAMVSTNSGWLVAVNINATTTVDVLIQRFNEQTQCGSAEEIFQNSFEN